MNLNLTWTNVSVRIQNGTLLPCLDHFSGYARSGRIVAFLGPSGSGKSTLLTLLSGRYLNRKFVVDEQNSRICLNNQPVNDQRLLLKQCGYVESPDEFSTLIGSITVHEHLVFQVITAGFSRRPE